MKSSQEACTDAPEEGEQDAKQSTRTSGTSNSINLDFICLPPLFIQLPDYLSLIIT
jgi:hypothetical protein